MDIKEAFDSLVMKMLAPLISKWFGSFLRTMLAIISGYLVNKNLTSMEEAATFAQAFVIFIESMIPAIIAQLSSLVQKKVTSMQEKEKLLTQLGRTDLLRK